MAKARTVGNVMSGPNGPRLKQLRKNNPNAAKRVIQNIMANPNKSVNNIIRDADSAAKQVNAVVKNARVAVQANKNAQQAVKQAAAKQGAAARQATVATVAAATAATTAASAARQAQRQVQRNPNVPGNAKNVTTNAAHAANNNARQANIAANIATTFFNTPPPPPPPPAAKQNQNGEPRGDGKYAGKAKKLWKDTGRMLNRAKKTNFDNTIIGQKLVDSLHKHVVTLSKSILDIKLEFKAEVSKLLAGHPDLEKTYKQLSDCDVETNNKSSGCPKIRNMDRYITEIKGAIGRKNNAQKLINKAKNVNTRQKLQEEANKNKKAQDELVARRRSMKANVNALISQFERLQKKI
jgi:hypothetical protein